MHQATKTVQTWMATKFLSALSAKRLSNASAYRNVFNSNTEQMRCNSKWTTTKEINPQPHKMFHSKCFFSKELSQYRVMLSIHLCMIYGRWDLALVSKDCSQIGRNFSISMNGGGKIWIRRRTWSSFTECSRCAWTMDSLSWIGILAQRITSTLWKYLEPTKTESTIRVSIRLF